MYTNNNELLIEFSTDITWFYKQRGFSLLVCYFRHHHFLVVSRGLQIISRGQLSGVKIWG